ncbi:hypothetical protein AYI69_g9949 [Smittium culicis]|nr:hypothetical protein AYI69_g9949 [Smittium culicis]
MKKFQLKRAPIKTKVSQDKDLQNATNVNSVDLGTRLNIASDKQECKSFTKTDKDSAGQTPQTKAIKFQMQKTSSSFAKPITDKKLKSSFGYNTNEESKTNKILIDKIEGNKIFR